MGKLKAFLLRFAGFVNDVGVELKKSAWPTRSELLDSTAVIVLSVVGLGVFVGASDYVLAALIRMLL